MAKHIDQAERDTKRKTYLLSFPADLDPERVTAWLRSISGTLHTTQFQRILKGVPSITLEVWADRSGITHRIKVPWQFEQYLRPKLESLVPGIRLVPEQEPPTRVWIHSVEAGLKAGHRTLRIMEPSDLSTALLANFSSMVEGETLMMQWVISPAPPEHKPIYGTAASRENGILSFVTGSVATRDEVNDRRDKLDEPNMLAVLRIGAVANTPTRAQYLVRGIMTTLDSSRGPATHFYKRLVGRQDLQARLVRGASPHVFPVQLSAPELTAVIGWPLGSPMIHGLPTSSGKRVPTPNEVSTEGIQLGFSNYSGRERRVALGFKQALVHQHIMGPPGKGKTVMLANQFKQIVDAKYGAVVIEQKGDLFQEALNLIPPSRIEDVIVIDVNDTKYPVGFNVLDDDNPMLAVDGIDSIFRALYRDHPSLWANLAMYHGLQTLAHSKNATLIDLLALLTPTADEVDWAYKVRSSVTDPQLKRYWQELENDSKYKSDTKMEPIHNRFWPVMRSNLINIFGQAKSSFTLDEVVRGNKILLVNLSGIDSVAAELMGAIIVSKLWQAVKANPMPESPNYLIMDEAHHFMNLPIDLGLMLVEARRFGLGVTFAHQGLYQLPPAMKQAVNQNMQTKIVFQTMADDARDMARVMGDPVTDYDISHLAQYDTWARLATPNGTSSPFTLSSLAPLPGYGKANQVLYVSRGKYGRPLQQVQDEILNRRSPAANRRKGRAAPDVAQWGI